VRLRIFSHWICLFLFSFSMFICMVVHLNPSKCNCLHVCVSSAFDPNATFSFVLLISTMYKRHYVFFSWQIFYVHDKAKTCDICSQEIKIPWDIPTMKGGCWIWINWVYLRVDSVHTQRIFNYNTTNIYFWLPWPFISAKFMCSSLP